MKKLFLTFLFFCQFAFVHAQEEAFGVIYDKDGYVNVRKGKSAQSKVLKGSITKPLFLRITMIRQPMVIGFTPMRRGLFIMIGSSG